MECNFLLQDLTQKAVRKQLVQAFVVVHEAGDALGY
jgi:hypothetical protein